MASEQELVVEEESIVPPRKLMAKPRYFMNRSLHSIAEVSAVQGFAGILADSNNDGGACAYKDIKEFKEFVAALKEVIAYRKDVFTIKLDEDGAVTYEPAPDGQLDERLAVLMPGEYEQSRYRNPCWKQPHLAVFTLLDVLSSHKDIELQSEITDWSAIDASVAALDKAVDYYFGGKIKFPDRNKLKNLNPPADFDYRQKYEPSGDNPATGFANQADVEIKK